MGKSVPTHFLRQVILLRNMVGPGEVDEELCRETEEECQEPRGPLIIPMMTAL